MTRPRQVGLWAGVIAVTVVIAHLPSFFHRLLDGDEAIYASIAALMNTGGQLYGPGGVDNKPPGIFWVYAATFQAAGTYQMTAIHAVGLAVIVATCVVLFVIGRDLGGVRTGLLAALFYGVLTAAGNPRLLATNTELFMMLPLTASVLLMLRRQWLWSGVLLVAAGAFRQVAAVNVLAGHRSDSLAGAHGKPTARSGMVLRRHRRCTCRRRAGPAVDGLALRFLALDGRQPVRLRLDELDTQLRLAAREGQPGCRSSWTWPSLWIAAIALATRWRRGNAGLDTKERLVIVWLAVAMIGSVAAGHLSWHYFIQAMGPLALAAAACASSIFLSAGRSQPPPRWELLFQPSDGGPTTWAPTR